MKGNPHLKTWTKDAIVLSAISIGGGGLLGVVACMQIGYENRCTYFGIPYLQAVIIGSAGSLVVGGLGGALGAAFLNGRDLIANQDMNQPERQRILFGGISCLLLGILGCVVLYQILY